MKARDRAGQCPSNGPGAALVGQVFSRERMHRTVNVPGSTPSLNRERRMNRNLLINILLIAAGIVLAIALFTAGILWKSRTAIKTSGLVKLQTSEAGHRSLHGD